jgi:hypothetical protein
VGISVKDEHVPRFALKWLAQQYVEEGANISDKLSHEKLAAVTSIETFPQVNGPAFRHSSYKSLL